MKARMNHPVFVIPEAMTAMQSLAKVVHDSGLSPTLLEIVNLRASQINGCSVCVQMHARDLKKAGESDERIYGVAAWRETSYFTVAERAALALTEATTRLSDHPDGVTDEIWDDVARHFDTQELAALVLAIGNINVWNRLNAATRQVAGVAG